MKVRVWISGEDGLSHDFELLEAPRVGEQVSITFPDRTEDGVVTSVAWHLQGIERATSDLSIDGEPLGSVAVVHVVCSPKTDILKVGAESALADLSRAAVPLGGA
jgi:hypothetical protein